MDIVQQLGAALGLGLLSGVRLYLTILVIGAAIHFHWLQLNASFSGLDVLADWRVMSVAAVACAVEFVADKVPWVDSAWDSIHTFIRPIGAALLGASAFSNADPAIRAMLMILCGGVALTGHSAKSATRLMVNHSPEPFSNVALSLAGDAMVPLATWFTFQYPAVTFGLVSVFLIFVWWLSPKIYRVMRVEAAAVGSAISRWFGGGGSEAAPLAAVVPTALHNAPPQLMGHMRAIPLPFLEELRKKYNMDANSSGVRCSASNGLPGLKSSIGYLTFTANGQMVFIARRWFRYRFHETPVSEMRKLEWSGGLIVDTFAFEAGGKRREFEVFRPSAATALPSRETAAA
jgi:hypothetical protein